MLKGLLIYLESRMSAGAISDCTLNREKIALAFARREFSWNHTTSVVDKFPGGWEEAKDPRVVLA